MRRVLTTVAVVAAVVAVASAGQDATPDVTRIIALSGRFSVAQSCPIAPYLAVTNGHVVDPQPFDPQAPLLPYYGQSGVWAGMLRPRTTVWVSDVALLSPAPELPSWYTIAKVEPRAGEKMWWVGYDWRNKDRAFAQRIFTGKVLRSVAGALIIDGETAQGSSGSCVLNASGEVVGIIEGLMGLDNSSSVTMVSALFPPWFKMPTEEEINPGLQLPELLFSAPLAPSTN